MEPILKTATAPKEVAPKATPLKAASKVVEKHDPMKGVMEFLAPYERKIQHGNLRVMLLVGPGTPTEEQIELPSVAGAIKDYFTKA